MGRIGRQLTVDGLSDEEVRKKCKGSSHFIAQYKYTRSSAIFVITDQTGTQTQYDWVMSHIPCDLTTP